MKMMFVTGSGQLKRRCWHCPGASRDVPEREMLPQEHSGCFKGLVPVLARTCVPRHKVHVVPALPAFFHPGGLSPGQDVRLWRGHQLRVAALTPKPRGGQSGLRPGPRQCRACGFGPFEIDWRCYGYRDLSGSSQRSDLPCTSHRYH